MAASGEAAQCRNRHAAHPAGFPRTEAWRGRTAHSCMAVRRSRPGPQQWLLENVRAAETTGGSSTRFLTDRQLRA
ncbi:hypothetical protein ACFH04_02295 [Streptomyces noboritoensis]|uniref:Uncharacterized protein n=1 Tax=Streptomyces noboritoensis TaxID=67337 RepID=A0ABV6TDL1_9ACTN